jgi:error-prone DNA polymerase
VRCDSVQHGRRLSEAAAQRIVEARRARPFASSADLAHRAALDRRDLRCLAEADALAPLAGHRHGAAWAVAGVERLPPLWRAPTLAARTSSAAALPRGAPFTPWDGAPLTAVPIFAEADPDLPAPTEGEDIVADYRTLSLTLRRIRWRCSAPSLRNNGSPQRPRSRKRRTAASSAPRASSSAGSAPTPRAA